jgi:tetratricopeptide (TPR) repeat protein/V8-like Glu-specific endopeptidase
VVAAVVSAVDPTSVAAQSYASPQKGASAASARSGVFGKDNRRDPPASYREAAQSVGQLKTRVGSQLFFCTTFCIDDDIVATAAHCLFAPGLRGNLTRASITVGQPSARLTTRIRGDSEEEMQWSIVAGTTDVRLSTFPRNFAHDWALVRIKAPLCKGRSLRVANWDSVVANWRSALEKSVFILGYHSDRGLDQLKLSDDCLSSDVPLESDLERWLKMLTYLDSDDIVPHRCDAKPGSSGAPVLVDSPDGPAIVGINVEMDDGSSVPAKMAVISKYTIANHAVAARAFEQQIALLKDSAVLPVRSELSLVQKALAERGYYKGRISGTYDIATRQAILDAERALGELPTGRPRPKLVAAARSPDLIPSRREPALNARVTQKESLDRIVAGTTRALEIDRNFTLAYFSRAQAYRLMGDNQRALADYTRAIELNPTDKIAYNERGIVHGDLGNGDLAIADHTRAIDLDGAYAWAYNNRGVEHRKAKNFGLAMADFDKAIALDAQYALAHRNRGSTYSDQGAHDQAIAAFTRAIELNPKDEITHNLRGIEYANTGNRNLALADYTRSIELDPTYASAYNNRGVEHRKAKNLGLAMADFDKAIALDPKYALAHRNRGRTFSDEGMHDQAIAAFTRAIELDPKDDVAYNLRGIEHADVGKWDMALVDYTRAIELDPKYSAAYNNRGYAHASVGQRDLALADYTRAIEINPRYALAYNNRGNTHRALGDFKRAEADYDMALENSPQYAIAASNRGHNHFLSGNLDASIADYTKAIALDPKNATTFKRRADAYFAKGDIDRADADYKAAVVLDPSNARLARQIGISKFDQGQFVEAATELARSVALKPDPYAVVYWFFALSRIDAPSIADLEQKANLLQDQKWPYALIDFLLGRRSAEATLAAASNGDERCEAEFFLAEWHLLAGEPDAAQAMLETAASSCPRSFNEYTSGVAELKRSSLRLSERH